MRWQLFPDTFGMLGSGPPLQDLLAGDWLFLRLAVRVGRKSRAADLHVAREQGSSCVLGGAGSHRR